MSRQPKPVTVGLEEFEDGYYIGLREGIIARSESMRELVTIDLDADGRVLGVEVLKVPR